MARTTLCGGLVPVGSLNWHRPLMYFRLIPSTSKRASPGRLATAPSWTSLHASFVHGQLLASSMSSNTSSTATQEQHKAASKQDSEDQTEQTE